MTPAEGEHAVDLAIIGAGPTGLFAAFYAGLRQMSVKLIDSLDILGGQLTTLYPEKFIYDVPGFPKVLAKELSRGLVEQAMGYRPTLCLGEMARQLLRDDASGGYRVVTRQRRARRPHGAHCRWSRIISAAKAFD